MDVACGLGTGCWMGIYFVNLIWVRCRINGRWGWIIQETLLRCMKMQVEIKIYMDSQGLDILQNFWWIQVYTG